MYRDSHPSFIFMGEIGRNWGGGVWGNKICVIWDLVRSMSLHSQDGSLSIF